jgi:hypothetical protein
MGNAQFQMLVCFKKTALLEICFKRKAVTEIVVTSIGRIWTPNYFGARKENSALMVF